MEGLKASPQTLERVSTSSVSRYLEEEATNSSKLDSLTLDFDESLNDSFFGSISESDEAVLIQKIPSMKCIISTPKPSKPPSRVNQSLLAAIECSNLQDLLNILTNSQEKPEANYKWNNDETFLHIASAKGQVKICEALLDYLEDIHINARNVYLMESLHIAAQLGHLQVAQLLVRSGADLNPIDLNGNTPLHLACMGNFVDLAAWLLSRGPSLDIRNANGHTAEDLAGHKVQGYFKRLIRKTTITAGPSISESQKLQALRAKACSISNSLPQQFEVLEQLGKGSFGEVFLVKKTDTDALYAMKVLDKEKIVGKNLTGYALTERNILSQAKHPFMVSLHFAFQTSEKLFLILDYCAGGDLARMISAEKRFSEARARVYLCEIVLALEELHKKDIIFRDLKPDNIVLDSEGHALLTDFGLSKEGINNEFKAKSFCGSVAYLAPEVLKRKGHGKSVDWYLLGVLFYEMLVGQPPYFNTNSHELMNNIQKGKLKIPANLSIEAKELIKDLLQRDPNKRLGAQRDAEEIKQHRFFKGIDWDSVYRRELKTHKISIPAVPQHGISIEELYGHCFSTEQSRVPGWSFISN